MRVAPPVGISGLLRFGKHGSSVATPCLKKKRSYAAAVGILAGRRCVDRFFRATST